MCAHVNIHLHPFLTRLRSLQTDRSTGYDKRSRNLDTNEAMNKLAASQREMKIRMLTTTRRESDTIIWVETVQVMYLKIKSERHKYAWTVRQMDRTNYHLEIT